MTTHPEHDARAGGRLQDLVIMTNDLSDAWRCLLEQREELDIRHARKTHNILVAEP